MTSPPAQTRRLHGVLLADVTGYSRLMSQDERRALAALERVRATFATVVPQHGGTLEVFVGDCFVALFASAVDAVQAAVAVQRALAAADADDPVRIRIGIHLGEVLRAGEGLFGDSINVAARLQTMAQPGAVAVSEDVWRAVRNKVSLPFRDLGARQLKNIPGRLRVYELLADADATGAASRVWRRRATWVAVAAVAIVAVVGLSGGVAWMARERATVAGGVAGQPAGRGVAAVSVPRAEMPSPATPIVVGVMDLAVRGEVAPWMRDVTRDGLNTVLSKVPALRVFSRQKIDFLREKRGLSELEAAEALGIAKMISGSLAGDGRDVALELQVVDIATGLLDASERVEGRADELIELQNAVAQDVLAAMRVELSPDERRTLFAKRTNETLDAYRLLTDTFETAPSGSAEPQRPQREGRGWLGPAPAFAEEEELAIRTVLEAYRAALEAEDVDALAALHVEMTDPTREALRRYFEGATQLRVQLGDVDVLVEGDDALATFNRKDDFVDARTGREMHLEVRLSSELVRHGGGWKLVGVKKS